MELGSFLQEQLSTFLFNYIEFIDTWVFVIWDCIELMYSIPNDSTSSSCILTDWANAVQHVVQANFLVQFECTLLSVYVFLPVWNLAHVLYTNGPF